MAESVRGINVVIGAETTGLSKALSDVDKKSREIQSELKQVERLLKFDPSNTELLAQKQRLLGDAIANTRERLDRLRSVQEQVNQQFARGEISEGQYRAFQREIAKTEQDLRRFEEQLKSTAKTADDFSTRLKNAGDRMQDVGDRMQHTGRNIAGPFAAAGAAIGTALGFAVNKAMDFEAQMDRVGAIAGATGEDLEKLRKTALDLGASTSKSATEAAIGMENLAAMGFNAQQIIGAMPGVIAAAEASGEDMAMVAETMAAALNSFALEASQATHVADVLAQAANMSAAGIQDMQYTFKYAAPVAKQLGISLEQLAAATAIMSNAGIRGEQAGTTLRAALLRLADPPKEAAEALQELGVKITDAQGNMLPFSQIIGQVAKATEGMGNAQKSAYLATIFGTEAVSGMLALIEAGPAKIDEFTRALENSTGASARTAQQMKDNLKGALEELSGAFETAQISIGGALAPLIQTVAQHIQKLVDWFNQLSPSAQQFIAIGALISAAVMSIIAVFGLLTAAIGAVISAIGTITTALAGVGLSIGAIAAPVGIAIAAFGALVAAGVLIANNWDMIKQKAQEVWQQLATIIQPAVDAVVLFITQKFQQLQTWWNQLWPQLKDAFANIWNAIKAVIEPIVNAIVQLMQWAWPLIKTLIIETWENVKGVIDGALKVIMGLLKSFASLFTGDWKGLWEGVKQIFSGAVELIWNAFQLWGTGKILKFVGFLGGQLGRIFKTIWDEASSIFRSGLDRVFSIVGDIFNRIINFVFGLGQRFYEAGKGLIDQMKKGIERAADAVIDSVKRLAGKVRDFLPFSPAKEGPLSDLDKLDFGGPIAKSIQAAMPRIQGLLDEMLSLPAINVNATVPSVGYQAPVASGVGGGNIIVQQMVVRNDTDIPRIARELYRLQQTSLRARGGQA